MSRCLAFILVTFVFPILLMAYRSIDDPVAVRAIPKTLELLQNWTPDQLPDEATYKQLGEELLASRSSGDLGKLATRLNYDVPGSRSAVTRAARVLRRGPAEGKSYRALFEKVDKKWAQPEIWAGLKSLNSPLTNSYYLASLDFARNVNGDIVSKPQNERIYVGLFFKTLWVSLLVTGLCVLLAYPISYQLATLPTGISNLLIILVLLPFWTSLLVRTTSWIVLLQSNGVLNDILVALGILRDDGRIQLIYNMFGTVVAMTHILLPFMVLPLYSVMKTIPPNYLRAAKSMGATPARAWTDVYLPLTVPGLGAGSVLVFILCIGYYITPALVGGRTGQLVSSSIAYHMQTSLNWGLAAALGTILLVSVLVLYWAYNPHRRYRQSENGVTVMAKLPPYVGPGGRVWNVCYKLICASIYLFLIAPILVIIPLSFNAEPYFTFTPGMLSLDPEAFSMRWYQDILDNEQWMQSIRNSFIIGAFATLLATTLGTVAALGLSQASMPWRGAIMAILISPMIVPVIITAAGMYFFYSSIGLSQTFLGLILAHTALGTPFVVITVTATLTGFDRSLMRASASLGATPVATFFNVVVPLITPGVVSGALFAFITSFDEVVAVLFLSGRRPTDCPAPDVVRYSRVDQPDHPGGRDPVDPHLGSAVADARIAAAAQRADARDHVLIGEHKSGHSTRTRNRP